MSTSPGALDAISPDQLQVFCRNNPDSAICAHVDNYYEYRINLGANAAFLAIFAASLLGFAVTLAVTRRGVAFNVAMMLGLICEILGYAGRIIGAKNPWDENGFYIQICCLTIGPAFMAAGIYLCLRRIVDAFGPENSRIPPAHYTRIFIPCDIVSLVLQAVGGAMAAEASSDGSSVDTGTYIMVAGLGFQVLTLIIFIGLAVDFALRTRRRWQAMGASALAHDPALVRLRGTWHFKAFLVALSLSAVCILWRSAFRVAELSRGWHGPIMQNQGLFIGFEGVLIVVAVVVLNIFHPVLCARELFEGGGGLKGLRLFRGNKSQREKSLGDSEGSEDLSRG